MPKMVHRKFNKEFSFIKNFSLVSGSQGNNKGFSFIELVVVLSILGVLIMLGTPKFMGYVEKAELARIQHDVKVMEDKMAEDSINSAKDYVDWDDNAKDLGLLVLADLLYETEGKAKNVAKPRTQYGDVASSVDTLSEVEEVSDYKIMPESMSKKIKTNLPGTFYTNVDGKVYYEHDKPLTRVREEVVIKCEAPEPLDYDFEHISGTIVKYNGAAQHLVIPSAFKVDDKCWPVRIIGRGAFMQGGYRTIVIPEGVQIIEEDAFKENKLESVTIPHGVGSVGVGAFAGNNLGGGSGEGGSGGSGGGSGGDGVSGGGVIIKNTPNNISIGSGAFSSNGPGGDTEATPQFRPATDKDLQVSFDKGAGAITDYKGNDTVVVIPPTIMIDGVGYPVKSIEKGAYQGRGLITVILPEGLERIEDYAFSGNQLIGITIPNSVNHIGNYAFAFNELEKIGNIVGLKTKATIKTIIIKNIEQFNKVNKYGDILENDKKVDLMEVSGHKVKTKLLDHIFVTSHGNIVINAGDGVSGKDSQVQKLINSGYIPIASANDLNNISRDEVNIFGEGTEWMGEYRGGLDKQYIQVADIEFPIVDNNFSPIGRASNPFTGDYNGMMYKIKGVNINVKMENVGFFGYIKNSNIKNLGLQGVFISGSRYVGGLVGYSEDSYISNSYTSGKVVMYNGYSGGLIGYSNNTVIDKSYSTVDPYSRESRYSGGLIGVMINQSQIIDSYARGTITTPGYSGGLVYSLSADSSIKNSYSIVGFIYVRSSSSITTDLTYASGLDSVVSGGGGSVNNIINVYFTIPSYRSVGRNKGTALNSNQLKDINSYSNFDFENIWTTDPSINNGYPSLQWQQ